MAYLGALCRLLPLCDQHFGQSAEGQVAASEFFQIRGRELKIHGARGPRVLEATIMVGYIGTTRRVLKLSCT